jgi:fatty acid-binding protein DegV
MDRMFQIATSLPNVQKVGVAYSTNGEEAEQMKRRIEQALEGVEVGLARLGPVIGVHGGPGTLGIGILQGE